MIPVLHLVDGMCSESLYTHIPVLKVIFMMRSRINEQRRLRHQSSLISFPIPFYATDTPVSCDELHTFSQYESRFATCTVSLLVMGDVSEYGNMPLLAF